MRNHLKVESKKCRVIEDSNDLVRVVPFFCFFFWANKKRKIGGSELQDLTYLQMKITLLGTSYNE